MSSLEKGNLSNNSTIMALMVFTLFSCSILIYSILSASVSSINSTAIQNQNQFLQSVINSDKRSLKNLVFDYSYWNDAISGVAFEKGYEWENANIGYSLSENLDIDLSIVINEKSEIHYLSTHLDLSDLELADLKNQAVSWSKAALKNRNENKGGISGIINLNGKLFITGASPLTPENASLNDFTILTEHLNVFLFARQIGKEFLNNISAETGFEDLQVSNQPCSSDNNACILLAGLTNGTLGSLSYLPKLESSSLIRSVVPQLLMLLLLFFLTSIWIIKSLLRSQAMLTELAYTDGLTGIFNRRMATQQLQILFNVANRDRSELSVITFDLDDFKNVNDEYGHDVGDKVLIHFSKLLKASSRASDVVGRYGGEEFIAILPGTNQDGANTFGVHLKNALLSKPFELNGKQIKYTFSAGIANLSTNSETTVEDLLKHSDIALYEAKTGKNRIHLFAQSAVVQCSKAPE